MWSKTFTDSYGWRWTFRRMEGWATVQLLASPPEEQRGRLEPFSYGFQPAELADLARILEEARSEISQEEYRARLELEREAELQAGRDPRD